jgi:hypothetical protein
MSFVRANLAGEPTEAVADPNPIVVETGIPGFSLTVPLTTPTRQKLAVVAGSTVAIVATVAGVMALGYLLRSPRSK